MKAGPINQPICVSLSPRSRLSGPISRGTIPRSSMLIMSVRAKTNTAYQARAGLGQGSIVASSAILFSNGESAEILVASVLIKDSYENQPRRKEEHEERKEKNLRALLFFVVDFQSKTIFALALAFISRRISSNANRLGSASPSGRADRTSSKSAFNSSLNSGCVKI